jgi:hypothetical protein
VRKTANPGCKHLGAGRELTIIKLVGAQNEQADGVIFGRERDNCSDGFEVHDMTLDCNATGNPNFIDTKASCSAISTAGSDITISNVVIRGFGVRNTNGLECFPVFIAPDYALLSNHPERGNLFKNVIVDNCLFESPATGCIGALTCCALGGGPGFEVVSNVIRNSTFLNADSSGIDYPHGPIAPLIENCTVVNCDCGVYIEPRLVEGIDYMIRSNVFRDVRIGVGMQWAASGARVKSVSVVGNKFYPRCEEKAAAFDDRYGIADLGNAGIDNLIIRDNLVDFGNCSSTGTAGFGVCRVDNLTIDNNQINLGSGGPTANGREVELYSSSVGVRQISRNTTPSGASPMVLDQEQGTVASQFETCWGVAFQPLNNNLTVFGNLVTTAGNIPVGNGAAWASVPVAGDAVLSSSGAFTVSKLTPSSAPVQGYNYQVLNTDLTLNSSSARVQHLVTPDGDKINRSVTLPAAAPGREFLLHNAGSMWCNGYIIVKNNSGTELVRLRADAYTLAVGRSDGTWQLETANNERRKALIADSVGWYRIIERWLNTSARIKIRGYSSGSGYDLVDLEFACNAGCWAINNDTVGNISEIHSRGTTISQIRLGSDGNSQNYVDVYVAHPSAVLDVRILDDDAPSITTDDPVKYLNPDTPPLYLKTLDVGPGLRTTGRVVANELQVRPNSSAVLTNVILARVSLDFPNLNTSTWCTNLTVSCTGAKIGDVVTLGLPANVMTSAGPGHFTGWVSTNDTVTVSFAKGTSTALDLPVGTFAVKVEQYQ